MFTLLTQQLISSFKAKVWPKIKEHGLEAIMIVFCFILLTFLVVKMDNLREEKQKYKVLEQVIESKEKEIQKYENSYNEIVNQVGALKLSKKTMSEMYQQKEFEWLLKFDNLKQKYKNLESAYQIALNASSKIDSHSFQDTVINITVDTVERVKILSYIDEYTKLKARIFENGKSSFEYNIKIPLQVVVYWNRKWFLGKKSWSVEAVSINKNVSIANLDAIIIKKK